MKNKSFTDAVKVLKQEGLYLESSGENSLAIGGISYHSKEIGPNTLFVCKGIHFDERYLDEALSNGAVCYVSENPQSPRKKVPYITVTNIRRALAVLAAWFYDYDPQEPEICAVTGTKGKSTTVYFLVNILKAAGKRTAFATTVDIYDGKRRYESTLTTPESLECQQILSTARESGCHNMVMEVSSQAYKMDRIYGLRFAYGIFVNITNDHISPDEHHTFEEYFACKQAIVEKFENAAVNLDDPNAMRMVKAAKDAGAKRVMTYSVSNPQADVYAKNIVKDGFKSFFTAVLPGLEFEAMIRIPGEFNISNALSAAAVAHMMGIPVEKIAEGIWNTQVPGRMNIYEKNGYTVIVDYAHNKDSLHSALKAITEYYPGKNIKIVFGCPGCKALQRREDMAEESSQCAKFVYVTSEDPSYEDPFKIANEVRGYLNDRGCPNEIIVDREEAVRTAIHEMEKDDLILIAGKGSEHYQVINGVAAYYGADTALAEKYIQELK